MTPIPPSRVANIIVALPCSFDRLQLVKGTTPQTALGRGCFPDFKEVGYASHLISTLTGRGCPPDFKEVGLIRDDSAVIRSRGCPPDFKEVG